MALEFDAPESFDQEGGGLREAGKYHIVVLSIEENPTNKDGKLIDNAVFRANLAVLDGTTPGQANKQFDLVFFAPKMTHKDRGEMAKKKIWFFANSIGCGSIVNGRMVLDFAQAPARQCCMEIEIRESKYKDQSGAEKVSHNPELAFCNVYHVDNPTVKDWPKDTAALSLLPPELRKKPEDFPTAGKTAAKPAQNGSKPTPPTPQTSPAAGAAGNVNLDDL